MPLIKFRKKSSNRTSLGKSKGKSGNPCKYHSYETFPAKAFFDVRETRNFQLMRPKPGVKTEELERIFLEVHETWFKATDNKKAERWIEFRNKIVKLTVDKDQITRVLAFIWMETPLAVWDHPAVVEIRKNVLAELNTLLDTPIDFDSDLLEEIERVMSVERGIIDDEITFLQREIDDIEKDNTDRIFNYYESIVGLETAHGRTLDEKMMLPKYVELEKMAVKINELQKQARNGK